jgi:uncharacterized membrane protein
MITVTLYYLPDSPECDEVRDRLESLQSDQPHQLVSINVGVEAGLRKLYEGRVPVVQVGPYTLESVVTRERLAVAIGAARDRAAQLEKIDQKTYQEKLVRGHSFTSGDRLSVWLADNYIHLFNLLILAYFGLAFLAPVLMKTGATGAAQLIYRLYSPLCHQLSYRSWFLFGEQAFYPRELAEIEGMITYEQATNLDSKDLYAARDFNGNAVMGFKVALCQRDVAMYVSMWIFGMVFWLSGRRIRPLPWYLWVLIGLVPIGVDGFSQLPGALNSLPDWLPVRESNPFLRTVTGGLFGVMTTWYLYPLIEQSMGETKRLMTRKQASATQSAAGREQ